MNSSPTLPRVLYLFIIFISALSTRANPIISEFMANNVTTIKDEDGAYSDWIEIHNPTVAAINLDQWCLTDTAANLTKWRFPAVTIQPGDFTIVWASSKNRTQGLPQRPPRRWPQLLGVSHHRRAEVCASDARSRAPALRRMPHGDEDRGADADAEFLQHLPHDQSEGPLRTEGMQRLPLPR